MCDLLLTTNHILHAYKINNKKKDNKAMIEYYYINEHLKQSSKLQYTYIGTKILFDGGNWTEKEVGRLVTEAAWTVWAVEGTGGFLGVEFGTERS